MKTKIRCVCQTYSAGANGQWVMDFSNRRKALRYAEKCFGPMKKLEKFDGDYSEVWVAKNLRSGYITCYAKLKNIDSVRDNHENR